jgi:hypothetical protein
MYAVKAAKTNFRTKKRAKHVDEIDGRTLGLKNLFTFVWKRKQDYLFFLKLNIFFSIDSVL